MSVHHKLVLFQNSYHRIRITQQHRTIAQQGLYSDVEDHNEIRKG